MLPDQTMLAIERNSVRFYRHAEALRQSGQAVKRGLLFYGEPGTGKTYTAKWLAQSLKSLTVMLMSGEQLTLIKECCEIARMLAPSLVIMEDIDLVATAREQLLHNTVLHQLLNEMDGMEPDAEVIFVLTRNRPQVIEPALAERPGRIDQAIEFPLPDRDCRRRLITLYARGLTLDLADPERPIARTEGASPAFIRELVRKAALFAAEDNSLANGTLRVTDQHFESALRELEMSSLTHRLFGFRSEAEANRESTK